jgi:hypothetical protein
MNESYPVIPLLLSLTFDATLFLNAVDYTELGLMGEPMSPGV